MNLPVPTQIQNIPVEVLRQTVDNFSLSESSWRVLRFQWSKFERWGGHLGIDEGRVCDYLRHLANSGIKASGLESARWAIDQHHKRSGHAVPTGNRTRQHLKGIKRILVDQSPGQVRIAQKQPLMISEIRKFYFDDSLSGVRDKTLLLVGFATGMRRSELSRLRKEDVEQTEFGLRVSIWKSKTNQEGLKETVDVMKATKGRYLDFCPAQAMQRLLEVTPGDYVFQSVRYAGDGMQTFTGKPLSGISIGKIVKQYAMQLGMDPADFGAHSLRAGCATYLLDHEVPPSAVQKQMRHKRFDTTQRYNRGETARALVGAY
jgi:integrase